MFCDSTAWMQEKEDLEVLKAERRSGLPWGMGGSGRGRSPSVSQNSSSTLMSRRPWEVWTASALLCRVGDWYPASE